MSTKLIPTALKVLSRDGWLLFVTRFMRLFAYGSLSVILVFYLVGLGLSSAQAGLVLTLTLVGDVVVSLYLTSRADRIGRRRILIAGSILMAAAVLAFLFARLSAHVEVDPIHDGTVGTATTRFFGLTHSRNIVLKLSSLFALDSFGGGFVVQSFASYWFYLRFGVEPGTLGAIFFWANLFAGISALLASRLAVRIGLVRTMVVTHLPSNILLILVPLMPTLSLAILVLLLRFSISQMDVPTRQSYTMAVVPAEERSAAGGVQ